LCKPIAAEKFECLQRLDEGLSRMTIPKKHEACGEFKAVGEPETEPAPVRPTLLAWNGLPPQPTRLARLEVQQSAFPSNAGEQSSRLSLRCASAFPFGTVRPVAPARPAAPAGLTASAAKKSTALQAMMLQQLPAPSQDGEAIPPQTDDPVDSAPLFTAKFGTGDDEILRERL